MSTPKNRVTHLGPNLNNFPQALTNLTGSFLAAQDLGRLATACKGTQVLFKKPREDKRAEELKAKTETREGDKDKS